MKVGWSAEVRTDEWVRLDLDESDLLALCHEVGFPLEQRHRIPPLLAYNVLDVECQRLVTLKLAHDYGMDVAQAKARLEELNNKRAGLVKALLRLADGATPE